MNLTRTQKKEIIDQYAINDHDTGSPEVQVALLTHRIKTLTEHLKVHKKDKHSHRGLLIMIGKRRRYIRYLKRKDISRQENLRQRLGLRIS